MSFIQHNTLLVVFLVIVVAGGAWWGLTSGSTSPLLASANAGHGEDQTFVDTLLKLNAISLAGTILKDPLFADLRDFGVDIVQEPSGRPNPFAPLTSKSVSVSDAGTPVAPQNKKNLPQDEQ